ncbi:unnamed protein product [marine sediment metagenome]|uniref:Uncharacterized protein n=1 Tax=marine sediment metagenome TaxID=412755 RepID=X0VNR1_9ZZZZ
MCINRNRICVCKKAETKLKRFLKAEQVEIEKYKWDLGIQLCHDPLEDRSINDICFEWISKYAKEFRELWESKNGKVTES